MPTLHDARFDNPLLNDAFDFSRYPTFKKKHATLPTSKSLEQGHRAPGCVALFACSNRGSPPSNLQRSRNVSEPQLISSTNYMRESWFTNFASAQTVGDIAHLSCDDDILPALFYSQSIAVACDTPAAPSRFDVDDDQPQKTFPTMCEDSCDVSGHAERSEHESEDSLYSMDSADQDAHPLLPVIPQIKLERKATVRKHEPVPFLDAARNQSLLSPCIRNLRTSPRVPSRRYGCILTRASPITATSNGAFTQSQTFQQSGIDQGCMHSTSEPILNSAYPSDGEEEPLLKKRIDDSPHSDVLLSMIDEAGSSLEPYSNRPESTIDELPKPKRAAPKRGKHGHRRSSMGQISFSSIIHAVADSCASLDLHLRNRPKPKPGPTTKHKPDERVSNAHDPTSKWAPKQGQITIKVFVPSTDDIWMFRVPQDINLADFTSKVVNKLGFSVSFSGSLWDEPKYYFGTDERFRSWVKGRIRFGRNLPIVAHVLEPLPLVKLCVDEDGCEVWCYA